MVFKRYRSCTHSNTCIHHWYALSQISNGRGLGGVQFTDCSSCNTTAAVDPPFSLPPSMYYCGNSSVCGSNDTRLIRTHWSYIRPYHKIHLHFNVIPPFWRWRKGYVSVAPLPGFGVIVIVAPAVVDIWSDVGAAVVLGSGVIEDFCILLPHRLDVKVTVCICNIKMTSIKFH